MAALPSPLPHLGLTAKATGIASTAMAGLSRGVWYQQSPLAQIGILLLIFISRFRPQTTISIIVVVVLYPIPLAVMVTRAEQQLDVISATQLILECRQLAGTLAATKKEITI